MSGLGDSVYIHGSSGTFYSTNVLQVHFVHSGDKLCKKRTPCYVTMFIETATEKFHEIYEHLNIHFQDFYVLKLLKTEFQLH
jgi:hypothetical protein